MITTEDVIIVAADSIEQFEGPAMVCFPLYNPDAEMALVDVSVRDGDGVHYRYVQFELSKTELDTASASASGNVDKWMEAIEETIVGKLENLNPGAIFTIT